MKGLWNLNWLNENSQRAYPISSFATKKCSDGDLTIPDDFLLAVNFVVPYSSSVSIVDYYISELSVGANGVSIAFKCKGYESAIASVYIPIASTDNDVITAKVTGLNDYEDINGYVAINPRSSIFTDMPGYYTFEYDDAALEPDCIRPMLRGVSSLRIKTSGGYSKKFYGDIVLVAGSNISLSVDAEDSSATAIRISAVGDSDYTTSCSSKDNSERNAIKSINGIVPSANGNISIQGTTCLSVNAGTNSITLEDTCAEPCCGCQELNALEEQIQRLIEGKETLDKFVPQVIEQVVAVETVMRKVTQGPESLAKQRKAAEEAANKREHPEDYTTFRVYFVVSDITDRIAIAHSSITFANGDTEVSYDKFTQYSTTGECAKYFYKDITVNNEKGNPISGSVGLYALQEGQSPTKDTYHTYPIHVGAIQCSSSSSTDA